MRWLLGIGFLAAIALIAAKLLGLNRNTLRKKIRDLDIEVVRGLK